MTTPNRITSLAAALTAGAVTLALGCAGGQPPAPAQPEPLIRVDSPSSFAHRTNKGRLVNDGERLMGKIEGQLYNVEIGRDRAWGQGPTGRIDVRLEDRPRGYAVNGTWNGGAISFLVSSEGIHGMASRQVALVDPGLKNCHYDVVKQRGRPSLLVYERCPGLPDNQPLRFDLPPAASADLADRNTGLLVIAYLLAPPSR
jgi:hypothetical protein